MSLYRLQDGNSYTFRMGAGTDGNNRPEIGRWMKITNNNALDMMIPQNSEGERNAVYANMGVGSVGASVSVAYGQYGVGTTLYNNTSTMLRLVELLAGRLVHPLLLTQHHLAVLVVLVIKE